MVRSTPITPAAARAGESHSRPKTWTGNFPAIFWAIALSWSAAMSNCGRFSWLHSEPCSLFPVGLGRNWYFLVQPQKKPQPNHGAMEWNAVINSVPLPIDAPYSISIICWFTISLPHASANGPGERSCQLSWPAVSVLRLSTSSQNRRRNIAQPHCCSCPRRRNEARPHRCSIPQNRRRNEARFYCHFYPSNRLTPLMLRPSSGSQNWWTNKPRSRCRTQNRLKKTTVRPSTTRPVSAGRSHFSGRSHCLGGFFASHFLGCFYSSVFCLSLSFGWLNSVACCRSSTTSWWLSTAMEMTRTGRRSKGGTCCGERRGQGCSFNARGWSRISNFWLIGREVWCGVEGRRRCLRLLSSNPDLLL